MKAIEMTTTRETVSDFEIELRHGLALSRMKTPWFGTGAAPLSDLPC